MEARPRVEHDGYYSRWVAHDFVLNGVKVTDYKDGDPVPARKFDFEPQRGPRPDFGYMGLQNHSDNDIVFFKEVAIKPLKK